MLKFTKLRLNLISIIKYFTLTFSVKSIDLFSKEIENCNTFLDLGCGYNSPLEKIKKRKKYSLGVDIFNKYIEFSKKKKIHDDYLLLNILDIDKKIPPKSFDCVLLWDVIEHLEKLEGLKLLKKIEKIAKMKIIIFTPNGFLQQHKYDKNEYQKHKSGWDVKIFKKLNFKIYGIRGLKFLRGDFASIKYKPVNLWRLISKISNIFVKYFPQLAFQLLCIKDL